MNKYKWIKGGIVGLITILILETLILLIFSIATIGLSKIGSLYAVLPIYIFNIQTMLEGFIVGSIVTAIFNRNRVE